MIRIVRWNPSARRLALVPRPARAALLLACAFAFSFAAKPAAAAAVAGGGVTLASSDDAIARSCPCFGPISGGSWRSHGQYLSCVTRAARREARDGALTNAEARTIVRDGARSTCGKSSPEPGNVRVCARNPVLPCPTVRAAHVDDCSECTAALAGELVHCARVASGSGVQGDVCGTAARIGALGKRAIEHRTGVDCQSCKAKLGTPTGEGTDCVAALCDSFLAE